jgi:hypothetical protein
MAFICGKCRRRHQWVDEARQCYGLGQGRRRKPATPGRRPVRSGATKKASGRRGRKAYPETYGGATGFTGKGSPPPRDAPLHKRIGSTQNYGEDT